MADYLNMRLQPADQRAIEFIKQATGVHTISEAIRLALHKYARGEGLEPEAAEDSQDSATGTEG